MGQPMTKWATTREKKKILLHADNKGANQTEHPQSDQRILFSLFGFCLFF